jgi:hypothetical protein
MQFDEIKTGVKEVKFDSLRMDCDNYLEAVVLKEEVSKLVNRLNSVLGSPVWPSNQRLSLEVRQVIDSFGGIMPGQTLYFRNQGSDVIFAMLWPWQDGVHTTLKVVKK